MLTVDRLELSDGVARINTSHKIGLQWWAFAERGDAYTTPSMAFSLFLSKSYTNEEDLNKLMSWIEGYGKRVEGSGRVDRIFSIEHDYPRLWSSFMSKFGIDIEKENLHWHKFLALFDIAVSNLDIGEIVRIRSYQPNKHDGKEYIESMRRAQVAYALENKNLNDDNELDGYEITKRMLEELRRKKKCQTAQ